MVNVKQWVCDHVLLFRWCWKYKSDMCVCIPTITAHTPTRTHWCTHTHTHSGRGLMIDSWRLDYSAQVLQCIVGTSLSGVMWIRLTLLRFHLQLGEFEGFTFLLSLKNEEKTWEWKTDGTGVCSCLWPSWHLICDWSLYLPIILLHLLITSVYGSECWSLGLHVCMADVHVCMWVNVVDAVGLISQCVWGWKTRMSQWISLLYVCLKRSFFIIHVICSF